MTKRNRKSAAEGSPSPLAEAPTDSGELEKPNATGKMDTTALDIESLATGILARSVKPRVADIRRLAEAVLQKKKKKKNKKDRKTAELGERKLSKIPARKTKK